MAEKFTAASDDITITFGAVATRSAMIRHIIAMYHFGLDLRQKKLPDGCRAGIRFDTMKCET
jgi:hypothetical protein